TFLAREAGRSLRAPPPNALPPDFVAGASVSSRAMRAGVLATARLGRRARGARTATTVPTLDVDSFTRKSFSDLLAEGAVVQRRVTSGEFADALAKAGVPDAKLDWPLGESNDLYIEFTTALITPPHIGGNLLGVLKFEDYKNQLPAGASAIYVASSGRYDFIGTKYFRASEGTLFDRLRVIQNNRTFRFVQDDYSFAVPVQGQQLAGLF